MPKRSALFKQTFLPQSSRCPLFGEFQRFRRNDVLNRTGGEVVIVVALLLDWSCWRVSLWPSVRHLCFLLRRLHGRGAGREPTHNTFVLLRTA